MNLLIGNDSLLALISVGYIIVPVLILARQWILRQHAPTSASLITTISIMLFLVLHCTCGGIVIAECIYEDEVARKLGTKDDEEILGGLDLEGHLKRVFCTSIHYTSLLWLLKAAFLGYFAHVRDILSQRARIMYTCVCIFTMTTFLVTIAFQFFYCGAIERNWSVYPAYQCIHFHTLVVSTLQATLNFVTDFMILSMALIIISSMVLSHRDRIALRFIAAVGSVSMIMCVLRFIEVYRALTNPRYPYLQVVRQLTFWAGLEVDAALVAFCAPAYKVLVTRRRELKASLRSSTSTLGLGSHIKGFGERSDLEYQYQCQDYTIDPADRMAEEDPENQLIVPLRPPPPAVVCPFRRDSA
ncbi:hypothetical protein BZA77DRAFT_77816 [Pyronema omphalodes]|nr:hypothetical protein BZA77DRAFT_77816 [Pyronema omphalodes]